MALRAQIGLDSAIETETYTPIKSLTLSRSAVLSLKDCCSQSSWDEWVDTAPISDVFYRASYVRASEPIEHGRGIALILASGSLQVFLPLLLRPLAELPFAHGESGFDAVTPYGYGGLLPLCPVEDPAKGDVKALLELLRQWCLDSNVVSCHIRLHPFLEQERWFSPEALREPGASLCFRALTTGIALSNWDNSRQCIVGMNESRRRKLKEAKRHLRVSWGGAEIPLDEALNLFRRIYEYRMTQLHADRFYYFPPEYYASLAAGARLGVALAWSGEQLVGGQLFLASRDFAHYHLGGANEAGFKSHASTLLTNEGANWAWKQGCKALHLGGGSENLFSYKKSYGGSIYRYYTLDVIADEAKYRDLFRRRVDSTSLPAVRQGFFPQYRA